MGEKFIELLRVNKEKAKVLFIPTAAIDDDAKAVLPKCLEELVISGINPENIVKFNCDRKLTVDEINSFDALYFAGGSPSYLYKKICSVGFDKSIETALNRGAVYVGASAGSMVACKPYLALVKCRFWSHAPNSNWVGKLPKIRALKVKNFQALIVQDNKIELLE